MLQPTGVVESMPVFYSLLQDAVQSYVLPWQVYPCRHTQQLLLEVGVDVHEAERLVQEGLMGCSLISGPVSSSAQATKSSPARAGIPGLTQHVIQQACMLAANAGMWGWVAILLDKP
jgi:hypothetical protein